MVEEVHQEAAQEAALAVAVAVAALAVEEAHHEEVAEAVVEEHPAVAEEAIVVDGAVADPASKEERESSLNLTDTPAYSLHGAAKKTSW